jgi:hypothetical protein
LERRKIFEEGTIKKHVCFVDLDIDGRAILKDLPQEIKY